jgi:hypothetical protein
LIVTPEGFPIAYEVLPGNTADKTTLKMFLEKIETQYGRAERIWVMDRGIPTEKVLEDMRTADPPVYYLVGTPRGRLTKLERNLLPLTWQAVRAGVSVKLLPQDGELYVFAESRDRVHKGSQGQGLALLGAPRMQRAMRQRQLKGLVQRLKQLQQMKFNDMRQLLLKLGEAKGRYRAAWRLIKVGLPKPAASETPPQPATSGDTNELRKAQPIFSFRLDRRKLRQVRRREGRYLLRTNRWGRDPEDLWHFYIQLTEVEAAFKNLKDDLQLRPIYHQLERRIEAHILILYLPKALHPPAFAGAGYVIPVRRVHGLLPAHHLAGTTQAVGTGSHLACRARQARQHPDARCPLPDPRWPHLDLESLHRTQPRPATLAGTTWPHPAAPTAPANHRRRPTRALTRPSPFVV